MTRRYAALARVAVEHTYYDGVCRDLDYIVPRDTVRNLARFHLLARVSDGGLTVLFQSNETGAPVHPAAGAVLRFGLKLANPSFSNFTAQGAALTVGFIRFRNQAVPAALDAPDARVLVGLRFAHALTGAKRPVSVTVKGDSGQALLPTVVVDTGNEVSLDLTALGPSPLSVEEDDGGPTRSTQYYLDPELASVGASGVLELRLDMAFYTVPPTIKVSFEARQETLKYYLVARGYSDADMAQLSISDEGAADDARPKLNFNRVEAAAFGADDLPVSALCAAGERVVLFRSVALVARRARGRRNVQLVKSDALLIKNLPQPGASQPDATVIVHVSK